MPHTISLQNLQNLATQPDHELQSTASARPTTAEGWWGGRAMRNLKVLFTDRTERNAAYRETKLDVLHSLRAIYGDEIGTKAFRAGVGRPAANGGWETSMSHPLTGRHIANMLAAAREATTADGVAELLASRTGDRQLVALFRQKLAGCGPKDLLLLAKAIQKWPAGEMPSVTAAKLGRLLADPETGPFQALAACGLIDTTLRDDRGQRRVLTMTDREGLSYGAMTGPESTGPLRRGQHVQLEERSGFFFCRTNEFADQSPTVGYGGDKLHVSVHPNDVGKAWNIVAPILYENRDLFHEFKVKDMSDLDQLAGDEKDLAKLIAEKERRSSELREKDLLTPDHPEIRQLEGRIQDLTKQVNGLRRVLLGNQLTLYASRRPDGDPGEQNGRIASVIREIETRLDEGGIRASREPDDSGHQIGAFINYRNDQQGGDLYVSTDSPDYPRIREDMKQQPLYQALTAAR